MPFKFFGTEKYYKIDRYLYDKNQFLTLKKSGLTR